MQKKIFEVILETGMMHLKYMYLVKQKKKPSNG